MERWSRFFMLGLVLTSTCAFAPPVTSRTSRSFVTTPSFARQLSFQKRNSEEQSSTIFQRLEKVLDRLDTLKSAGLVDPKSTRPLLMRGPGFKRIFFWLFVGFMYKWYRARFINKIPVWDRQPQWNMVVTNREQEKELKAYTCKNCGSTLFIARNRNWFFEGDTGLGGLGCYTCGAKGKDNFVMDRDRILEDVGEDDDYFDYERPLDFVTAAERRALLKRAKGDEEVANQMLIDQTATKETKPEGAIDAEIEKTAEMNKGEPKETETEITELDYQEGDENPTEEAKETTETVASAEATQSKDVQEEASEGEKPKEAKKYDPIPEPSLPIPEPSLDDLDLDALGMDGL